MSTSRLLSAKNTSKMAKKPGLALDGSIQWSARDAAAKALQKLLPKADQLAWIAAAIDTAQIQTASLALRWVGPQEAQTLNRSYRGKDYATNVLTFEYAHAPVLHADIVICVDVLIAEALGASAVLPWSGRQAKSLRQHAAHLIVHGVLHAQGYDHERTGTEARKMENAEMLILHSLGFENPYAD
jgi:probable rRNA maturation factor